VLETFAFGRVARVLFWLAVPSLALAQETTGAMAGWVRDAQGQAVPDATVTLLSGRGARTFRTDAHGSFLAPNLAPDVYAVRVERAGLRPLEQRNVRVRLGHRVELADTLVVGAFQERVDVASAAPVIDRRSTTAGGVIDTDDLLRLPVLRGLTSTLYLVPQPLHDPAPGPSGRAPGVVGASKLPASTGSSPRARGPDASSPASRTGPSGRREWR
jgi:hypothetical protein